MRGLVDDEAVDAVEELLVGGGLEGGGRPGPGRLGSGHGFGGGQILAVDVGHRGGLAVVGVVAELLVVDAGPLGPHGTHGNVVELFDFHAVADKGAAAFVGLAVVAHGAGHEGGLDLAVVLVGDEVGDGLAEVPKEPFAGGGGIDQTPGEDRQPGHGVIAAATAELLDHVVGPIQRAGLPTVCDDVLDAAFAHPVGADGLLVAVEVVVHVAANIAAIELVHLETRGFGGCRVVGNAEQRVAEA